MVFLAPGHRLVLFVTSFAWCFLSFFSFFQPFYGFRSTLFIHVRMFPKIVGFPPKSSILMGFSITNYKPSILGVLLPLFLETPTSMCIHFDHLLHDMMLAKLTWSWHTPASADCSLRLALGNLWDQNPVISHGMLPKISLAIGSFPHPGIQTQKIQDILKKCSALSCFLRFNRSDPKLSSWSNFF